MSGEICTDNRFEIIAAYRRDLLDGTNIETSPEEMAVIDNILFRFWQMGWLKEMPQTNSDRIRSMTDEELADFLDEHTFSLFGMWARSNFILEFLQSDDWDGFMRSTEKGLAKYSRFEQKQNQTNADRVRNMTDEELARWIDINYFRDSWCKDGAECSPVDCSVCILGWLKSPVEGE